MFVTATQFYVFIACVAFGGVSGIVFNFSLLLKKTVTYRWVGVISDVFCFCVVAVGYVLFGHVVSFPNIRAYMIIGVILGIVLYFKSFYIILAKKAKKLYNIIKRKKRKTKNV